MNFLLLGCNGMAGHTISLYLKEQGHDVFGIDLQQSNYVDSLALDVTDTSALKKIIDEGNYDSIINCVGILNQSAEQNKALASFLNSYFPHFLAQVTAHMKTNVIHMSTDCVFSGKQGKYTENAFCDGETFYDRSKALGELNDNKNITLRTSIIGPDINPKGIGLLNWFMQQSVAVNGFEKAIWTGQTTLQLAKTMESAALSKATGLYNMVPETSISKYELLKLFNKYFKNGKIQINKVDGIVADKSLKRTNYDFDFLVPNYETMVAELAIWMKNHKEMYPHYEIFERCI